jgi:hypothetical protein
MENGLDEKKRVAYFEYDFSKHGGVAGDIDVYGDGIPSGAIVNGGLMFAKAAVTGGTAASVALKAISATDIKGATVMASLTLNAIVPVKPSTTPVRITSSINKLTLTVATSVTAGKLVVGLEYLMMNQE